MDLRNREGRPVDAVPFLVVSAMAFLVSFSYGPVYLIELGVTGPAVVGLPAMAFVLATAVAYHRFVWTVHPDLRGEIPVETRLRRLFYAVLVGVALLAGLSLPLLRP